MEIYFPPIISAIQSFKIPYTCLTLNPGEKKNTCEPILDVKIYVKMIN